MRVVENGGPVHRASGWSITPTPVFRVGWNEGDPEFQNVLTGAITADRRAVVADDRAAELIAIPFDGGPIETLGGRGEGPGEFNGIVSVVALGGDTVLVADARNNRITLLDGAGAVVNESSYQPMLGFARYGVDGRLNGEFALIPVMTGGSANDDPGWKAFPVLRATDFANVEPVVEVPILYASPGGAVNPVRLSGHVRAGPHGFVHARTDLAEVSWYSLDGSLTQVARWDEQARPVNEDDWNRLEAYARTSLRLPPERLEETLERWRDGFGGVAPLFGLLHVDHDGNVWLGEDGLLPRWERRFRIVSHEGVRLGLVEFPAPVWVLDLSGTHALVVEANELDVQAVALYDILKP